jgi:dethiobiotin synthetase
MRKCQQKRVFVTGTDTGVGKTVFTIRLLRELRRAGKSAIALKPFCSGDREDALRIVAEMNGERTLEEINPYYCERPVAPGVAPLLGESEPGPSLPEILRKIRDSARGYDWVIVEGAGGVLVPLTERLVVADLIRALKCPALVVGRDRLGTVNHSLLTLFELQRRRIPILRMVLMENFEKDLSRKSNKSVISHLVGNVDVMKFPKVDPYPKLSSKSKVTERILKITLAKIWDPRIVWPR